MNKTSPTLFPSDPLRPAVPRFPGRPEGPAGPRSPPDPRSPYAKTKENSLFNKRLVLQLLDGEEGEVL